MEGKKQNIVWVPQKKTPQNNSRLLREGTDESKEQAKDLSWRPSLEGTTWQHVALLYFKELQITDFCNPEIKSKFLFHQL